MAAVWTLARARLRARWRSLLGLALLVGVASGAVVAAAIGACRTDTAYARLLEATRADHVEVEVGGFEDPGFMDRVELPQVARLGLESVALLAPAMPGDPREYKWGTRLISMIGVDGRVGRTVNRPLVVAGRRPDPDRADEVGISESLARRWGCGRVGRCGRAAAVRQVLSLLAGEEVMPAGPALALQVAAVQRLPNDVSIGAQASEGFIALTPAFYRAYRDRVATFPPAARVRLERGRPAWPSPTRRGRRRRVSVISEPISPGSWERDPGPGGRPGAVRRPGRGGRAGGGGPEPGGSCRWPRPARRRSGRSARVACRGAMLPIALVGCAGAVAGAGIAVLASPLMPMGLALRVEPDPGFSVHLAGVALGMVATLVLVAGRVAVPAWRLAGQRPHRPDATGPPVPARPWPTGPLGPACRPARWPGCAWRWSRAGPAGGAGAHLAGQDHRRDRRLHRRGHLRRQSRPAARHPRLAGWNFDAVAGTAAGRPGNPTVVAGGQPARGRLLGRVVLRGPGRRHRGRRGQPCSRRPRCSRPWSRVGSRAARTRSSSGRPPCAGSAFASGRPSGSRPAARPPCGSSAGRPWSTSTARPRGRGHPHHRGPAPPRAGPGIRVRRVLRPLRPGADPGAAPQRNLRRPPSGPVQAIGLLGRRPTSRTWGGSAIYRTCSPGCSPCWPSPSPTCW